MISSVVRMSLIEPTSRQTVVHDWIVRRGGDLLSFRLATTEDAEFILSLRQESSLNQHLSKAPESAEAQRAWLSEYLAREIAGLEFYFLIITNSIPVGTIRLYRITNEGFFTWGSWVIQKGAPLKAGIQSALLIYQLAFEELGLLESRFEVRKGNARVIAFHERCGAERIGESTDEILFRFPLTAYEAMKAKYQ